MQNQPLSSGDQAKLLIFFLIMIPLTIVFVGVIPSIFLAFGIYMMKKNNDFSSIDTAVKNVKGYTWLFIIGGILASLIWAIHYPDYKDKLGASIAVTVYALLYLNIVHFLFYCPLKKHSEWVVINGIFSTKPKAYKNAGALLEVDIIKEERLKQYSVADELIKWAKLKEDGHISEDEFNEARAKLLKRS